MHPLLVHLVAKWRPSGLLAKDVRGLLTLHGKPHTADHSAAVASEAERLARRFGANVSAAVDAAWLHDVSAVFPSNQRAQAADALGIEVLPEERAFPTIVHQKLSVVLARELFGVTNDAVLSAVGCHTTLKAGATALDQVVFLADKIAWDQPGTPPYLADLLAALEDSLSAAALVYLNHLWEQRHALRVLHPWVSAARDELLLAHQGAATCP